MTVTRVWFLRSKARLRTSFLMASLDLELLWPDKEVSRQYAIVSQQIVCDLPDATF